MNFELTQQLIDSAILFVSGFLVGGIFVGVVAHQSFDKGVDAGLRIGRVERVVLPRDVE